VRVTNNHIEDASNADQITTLNSYSKIEQHLVQIWSKFSPHLVENLSNLIKFEAGPAKICPKRNQVHSEFHYFYAHRIWAQTCDFMDPKRGPIRLQIDQKMTTEHTFVLVCFVHRCLMSFGVYFWTKFGFKTTMCVSGMKHWKTLKNISFSYVFLTLEHCRI